jgi:hypothetical protein
MIFLNVVCLTVALAWARLGSGDSALAEESRGTPYSGPKIVKFGIRLNAITYNLQSF